jgi:hypothetical protein
MQDVRAELLRSVAPGITQADMYPKARSLINDEEYLYILRDMFNLSNVLDDMEFTGWCCHRGCHPPFWHGRTVRSHCAQDLGAGVRQEGGSRPGMHAWSGSR